MSVTVCIASRGRPKEALHTIATLISGMALPDTQIVIALDNDEAGAYRSLSVIPPERLIVSNADREDSLGAKYNRAAACAPASTDLFVLWADDTVTPTIGWDARLKEKADLFNGEAGVVYFGNVPGVFLPGIAVTKAFVEAQGFFCPPMFPFWWHDTWIDEVARFADRILVADVEVQLLDELKGNSRGVREIAFWGQFFDRLRGARIEAAQRIIATEPQAWRREQLTQRIPSMAEFLNNRNKPCSDPEQAKALEAHYSFDAPADERYIRLKAAAEAMINGRS